WYKEAIGSYKEPIAVLYYADVLKALAKYDEAIVQYNKYKELVPTDTKGAEGAEACVLAQKWKDNPSPYDVIPIKSINSKGMDMCARFLPGKKNTIIFSSSREGSTGNEIDATTGQPFSDIYTTRQDRKGAWKTPEPITTVINSKSNEGAACFNSKGDEMFFTRCDRKKKKALPCVIMRSKFADKEWKEPELVKLTTDSATPYSFGHPTLSNDDLELFFASDLKGGFGGKDIWVAKRKSMNDQFGEPENLGKEINTDGDELFPFVRDNGEFYFSSTGHVGMGGLDIFKADYKDGKYVNIQNLKAPINSPADDYGIAFKPEKNEGFITSNREGTMGSDDIFYFKSKPILFTLKGIVKDDSTQHVISGATVKMVGSDQTVVEVKTDKSGAYSFNNKQFLENTTYDLSVSKKGYFNSTGKETTVGYETTKDITHDFTIKLIPKAPIELPNILYVFNKWDLTDSAKKALDGLVKTLKDNPTLVIELSSHTDSRGSFEYNDTLSQKRAESVVKYLVEKGIEIDRLVAKGYGERKLKNKCKDGVPCTEEEHQVNRRTEFAILRDNYVPKNTNINVKNEEEEEEDNSLIQKPKVEQKVTPPAEEKKETKKEEKKEVKKKEETKEEPAKEPRKGKRGRKAQQEQEQK
ncbi:MAG: OmpA family protein, partial [Bacteroidota bacterium]|nr:OmpA family protein [Bacteroidota bacterium]